MLSLVNGCRGGLNVRVVLGRLILFSKGLLVVRLSSIKLFLGVRQFPLLGCQLGIGVINRGLLLFGVGLQSGDLTVLVTYLLSDRLTGRTRVDGRSGHRSPGSNCQHRRRQP